MPGSEGPQPTHGARGRPGAGMALTALGGLQGVWLGWGQCRGCSRRWCRVGGASRGRGMRGWAPLCVPGKGMLAELPRPQGPHCHQVSAGGCSHMLSLPCSTVGTVQVMATANGEGFGVEAGLLPQPWLKVGCPGQAASGCLCQAWAGWVQECSGTRPGTQTTKRSP